MDEKRCNVLPSMDICIDDKKFIVQLKFERNLRFRNRYYNLDTDKSIELIKIIKEEYLKTQNDIYTHIEYLEHTDITIYVNKNSGSSSTWIGVYKDFPTGKYDNVYEFCAGQYITQSEFDRFIEKANDAYECYIKNIIDNRPF